jgi:ferredoxin
MNRLRAIVLAEKCQGFAACVRAAPTTFTLGLDQIAEVDNAADIDRDLLMKAAKGCPFKAIVLTDETSGAQVYPAAVKSAQALENKT